MKRETHQFAKGRKNKWRNKYNHVWLYLYLLIAKKIRKEKALGRHTKSPIRSPCPRALRHRALSKCATWQLKELGTNSFQN